MPPLMQLPPRAKTLLANPLLRKLMHPKITNAMV